MKLAILTCGMLPIPAIQGGAVENLIDFYLEYNNKHQLYDITVYSPWDSKIVHHPALSSNVNHYIFIDVSSLKARIARKLYGYLHHDEYYNHFIEYYFEKVYADLKKKDFDYIIIENGAGLAYKLSQRGYRNLILHMHNEVRPERSQYHEVVFGSFTKIITVSDYIKQKAAAFYPIEKIHTVHNGIDLQNFSRKKEPTVSRQDLGFSVNDFVMVYNGRINPEKGVSELIEAMLQLKDHTNIKLMIIGGSFFGNTNNEDTFVRSLKDKAHDVKDRIFFTGFIPYKNVPDYLKLADIAVLPSMWEEPFGLTIVEAMAAGLPLITTRSGGIPEICEGVATIVERDGIVMNLVNSILNLYKHPQERKQESKKALIRVQHFDKNIYAQQFLSRIIDL
ncbi:MAG: glycosyltransferase family 4 protein [Prevotella sp.]|nr:glycosyltransferase family 4 protein [Prevotella sp.]